MRSGTRQLGAWLRVFRLPNLLTAPGDVMVGYAAAVSAGASGMDAPLPAGHRWPLRIVVSLLVYASGLALNDYFDRRIDARERPGRPIPSGAVPANRVRWVASALLVSAGLSAVWSSAVVVFVPLTVFVLVYNRYGKHHPVFGPLTMGACRFLNVMLGASPAILHPAALTGAALIGTYIVAVSHAARMETRRRPGRIASLAPAAIAAGGFAVLWWAAKPAPAAAVGGLGLAVAAGLYSLRLLLPGGVDILPSRIGGMVRALILLQAALLCLTRAPFAREWSLLLIMMWAASTVIGTMVSSS